jgi:hypothetical protein
LASTNAAWQSLSAAVEKRERELDAAIQSLGSIRQAQQSLLNWLDQTEASEGEGKARQEWEMGGREYSNIG